MSMHLKIVLSRQLTGWNRWKDKERDNGVGDGKRDLTGIKTLQIRHSTWKYTGNTLEIHLTYCFWSIQCVKNVLSDAALWLCSVNTTIQTLGSLHSMHSRYSGAGEHLDLQEFKIGIAPFKACQQLARERLEIWVIVSHSKLFGLSMPFWVPSHQCRISLSSDNQVSGVVGVSFPIQKQCEFIMWFFMRAISWQKFPHRLQKNDKEWADVSGVWVGWGSSPIRRQFQIDPGWGWGSR